MKIIILSNKSVVNNKQLFQIYILCTNDTSTVDIMTIKIATICKIFMESLQKNIGVIIILLIIQVLWN